MDGFVLPVACSVRPFGTLTTIVLPNTWRATNHPAETTGRTAHRRGRMWRMWRSRNMPIGPKFVVTPKTLLSSSWEFGGPTPNVFYIVTPQALLTTGRACILEG